MNNLNEDCAIRDEDYNAYLNVDFCQYAMADITILMYHNELPKCDKKKRQRHIGVTQWLTLWLRRIMMKYHNGNCAKCDKKSAKAYGWYAVADIMTSKNDNELP